jgi:uncharacterized membrane protein
MPIELPRLQIENIGVQKIKLGVTIELWVFLKFSVVSVIQTTNTFIVLRTLNRKMHNYNGLKNFLSQTFTTLRFDSVLYTR